MQSLQSEDFGSTAFDVVCAIFDNFRISARGENNVMGEKYLQNAFHRHQFLNPYSEHIPKSQHLRASRPFVVSPRFIQSDPGVSSGGC